MENLFFDPGNNGFQNIKRDEGLSNSSTIGKERIARNKDEDLIIEENTIYEIDRDCFERLKRQKKKR